MQQYPRLTFRLNEQLLNKIARLSRSRHRSRGAIIREAIDLMQQKWRTQSHPRKENHQSETWKYRRDDREF